MAEQNEQIVEVTLDGSNWETASDFYRSFSAATGAPEWFGNNLDALNDAFCGGICEITPRKVNVANLKLGKCSADFRELWGGVLRVFEDKNVDFVMMRSGGT